MKVTTKLKTYEQLKELGLGNTFIKTIFVHLGNNTFNITWNKCFQHETNKMFELNLEWLDTLTFTDDSNRFSFELQIDGLKVTVKPIYVFEVAELSFKDKFTLRVSVHSYCPTALYDNMLALVRGSATTKNFKSQKELTKFIGRLCRVKGDVIK